MNIAFIPAKHRSRRLPGKNFRIIDNRALWVHARDAALSSKLFDEVVVSTEHDRPPHLCHDSTGVVQVILETCQPCDYVCCIYPSPFIQAKWLTESFSRMNNGIDMVMGVQRYVHHQPLMDLECTPMPEAYQSCGSFYWAEWTALNRERTFYGNNCIGYEIPSEAHIDINTPEDYHEACALYETLQKKNRLPV